jgi:hypothetical protein
MLRLAVGAHKRDPHSSTSDAMQAAALVIVGVGFAVAGTAVVLRLKQLQSD